MGERENLHFSGDSDAVGLESKLRTTEVLPFLVSIDFAYDMAQDYTVASPRLSTPVPLHSKPGTELLSALGVYSHPGLQSITQLPTLKHPYEMVCFSCHNKKPQAMCGLIHSNVLFHSSGG